jgi:integrase
MKTLSTVFNAARRLGLLSSNPVSPVELPQRVKQVRRRTFTPEQVAMLLGVAEGGWRTVILLGYYAGLRLSDAVTLSWESVDLAGGCLRFEQQKTGEELVIPLHSTLELHLSKLAGDTGGPVCPALAVVPVGGRSGLSRQFLALMREAGVGNDAVQTGGQRKLSRLSFHALRVTYNSTMHNAGVTQEVRKKLTGHKSDAVNDRYTRTELDTLRAAVNTLPSLKA